MNSKIKVDFSMNKNNDFLKCLIVASEASDSIFILINFQHDT